jgi:hypothetical protein
VGATIFLAEHGFSQEKLGLTDSTDSTNVTVIVIFLSIHCLPLKGAWFGIFKNRLLYRPLLYGFKTGECPDPPPRSCK